MKKIVFTLLCVLPFIWSCEKSALTAYEIPSVGINFFAYNPTMTNPYPDELFVNYNFGVNAQGENLMKDTIWVTVEIQGQAVDSPMAIKLKVDTILEGLEPQLVYPASSIPPGAYRTKVPVVINRSMERGQIQKFKLGFDHSQMDFIAGVEERSQYIVELADVVNMDVLKMTSNLWVNFSGEGFFGYDTGYGSWSDTKARFIMTYSGITDFSKLPLTADLDFTTWEYGPTEHFKGMVKALTEYKAKSAADPVTYPPYYDENEAPNTWISFYVNYEKK